MSNQLEIEKKITEIPKITRKGIQFITKHIMELSNIIGHDNILIILESLKKHKTICIGFNSHEDCIFTCVRLASKQFKNIYFSGSVDEYETYIDDIGLINIEHIETMDVVIV